MPKAMVISVGGSERPLKYTLERNRPQYIIFFTSRKTEFQATQLTRQINFTPKCVACIVTPSAEKLSECYECLATQLEKTLKDWKIKPRQLLVDYTGGTKTMSAALVLATIGLGCKYSYVGGTERDKEGIGIVINGKEKRYLLDNPWEKLAVKEREKVSLLFNKCLYEPAIELLLGVIQKVGLQERERDKIWLEIVKGYNDWDKFKYREAYNRLNKGYNKLIFLDPRDKAMKKFLRTLKENIRFLKTIVKDKEEFSLVYDLISNAKRRAEVEGRYDDAVARIYRAIEKTAQVRLKDAYGINTSNVQLDRIPEHLREAYGIKYRSEDGKIKLPLWASYELLRELKDDLGKSFFEMQGEIRKLMYMRNSSKLAHGDKPIDRENYEASLSIFFRFTGITTRQIPAFPSMVV